MGTYFVGEIIQWPVGRIPEGWLPCNGSLQSINDFQVLYAVIGTTYGGDGQNTFGLPDLRSRVPVGAGQGPGLQNYPLGAIGGVEQVTLSTQQLPPHTHPMAVQSGAGNSAALTSGGVLASQGPDGGVGAAYAAPGGSQIALSTTSIAGSSVPHSNIQPSLGLNYIICFEGFYPSPN